MITAEDVRDHVKDNDEDGVGETHIADILHAFVGDESEGDVLIAVGEAVKQKLLFMDEWLYLYLTEAARENSNAE